MSTHGEGTTNNHSGFKSFGKGKNDQGHGDYLCSKGEFFVFVQPGQVEKWRKDKSIPMVEVVDKFEVYKGKHGEPERPAKGELESEFGTHNVDDVITQLLTSGELKNAKAAH